MVSPHPCSLHNGIISEIRHRCQDFLPCAMCTSLWKSEMSPYLILCSLLLQSASPLLECTELLTSVLRKRRLLRWDNKAAELFPKIQPQKMLKQLVIDIIQFTFLTVNSQALWHTNIVIHAIYKLIKNNSLIKYFGCTTALPSQPIR